MISLGDFGFGGVQRSYSFNCLHADKIPNSTVAILCPTIESEWVMFQNDPNSSGDILVGSNRLSIVGNGILLQPGQFSGWLPANNLNLFFHKDSDATSYLNYMLIGCASNVGVVAPILGFLQQEDGDYLLQESGDKIIL
jgi:hypothetical protein